MNFSPNIKEFRADIMDDIPPPSTPDHRPPSRAGAVKGQETPRSDPPAPGQYGSFREGGDGFGSNESTG